MWDKVELMIPFHSDHVSSTADDKHGNPTGRVGLDKYGFNQFQAIRFVNGEKITDAPKSQKWDTIKSSMSGIAVGFYPEGNGMAGWPHVMLKCSPAKLLQGHNVFGSEDIRQGTMQMIGTFAMKFPAMYADLDMKQAEVRGVDSTYSAKIDSQFYEKTLFRLFESLAIGRTKKDSRFDGYIKLGLESQYQSQKIYLKLPEVMNELQKCQRTGEKVRAGILADKKLLDFANGLMRFENSTRTRKFFALGIPTRLDKFLKYHDEYEAENGEPLSRYLWRLGFGPLFKQLEGQTMKKVDDDSVRLKIDATHIKIKDNGKLCKRRANSAFKVYRQIKTEGYERLASENNKAFYRNVNWILEAGLSRAFLKSLDPCKPLENVIPMVQLIKVDFSKQRPDWYEEPTAHYDDERRHLRLVG